jgi:hypothetical protein
MNLATGLRPLPSQATDRMRIAFFQVVDRGDGDQRLWSIVDDLDVLGSR